MYYLCLILHFLIFFCRIFSHGQSQQKRSKRLENRHIDKNSIFIVFLGLLFGNNHFIIVPTEVAYESKHQTESK